ncbi:Light-harvesting protein [Roseibacterium elongatum DSM 19469]|uniref:Light-harvesting protein n=2 Tax=Roseicyclus elongatus TaxID=159346 RepID=W8RY60_9RHOB|nr:Light-harvesting protein [Roseibacterium elongatum DSM 19469]
MKGMGYPHDDIIVVSTATKEPAETMAKAGVKDKTAAAYMERLEGDAAVLIVRASYRPLTATTIARELLAAEDTVDMGKLSEENVVKDAPAPAAPRILKEHPLFLTRRADVDSRRKGPITPGWGFKLLSKRTPPENAVMKGGKFMSQGVWPMPLVSDKPREKSVMTDHRFMSESFWPAPLLSHKERYKSVTPGGDLPFSRWFNLPTILRTR